MRTPYRFNLFKGTSSFLLFFVLGSFFLSHGCNLLGNSIFVTLTKLMVSNAGRIVGYKDFAEITPFVTLTNPVLKREIIGKPIRY